MEAALAPLDRMSTEHTTAHAHNLDLQAGASIYEDTYGGTSTQAAVTCAARARDAVNVGKEQPVANGRNWPAV